MTLFDKNIFLDSEQTSESIEKNLYNQLYKEITDFVYDYYTKLDNSLKLIYVSEGYWFIKTNRFGNYGLHLKYTDNTVQLNYTSGDMFDAILKFIDAFYIKYKDNMVISKICLLYSEDHDMHTHPIDIWQSQYMTNPISHETCQHMPAIIHNQIKGKTVYNIHDVFFNNIDDFNNVIKSLFLGNKNLYAVHVYMRKTYINTELKGYQTYFNYMQLPENPFEYLDYCVIKRDNFLKKHR